MVFDYAHGVLLGVHSAAPPDPEVWRAYCARVAQVRDSVRGTLVYTVGGGPTSVQREELRLAYADHRPPRMAILTASSMVRGIITSLNWFLRNQLVAFAPTDLNGAFAYLEASAGPLPRLDLVRQLRSLASRIDLELPAHASVAASP